MKPPTKKSSKKRAWDAFSIYIRTRDCLRTTGEIRWGRCISCGELTAFDELQAGHYLPGRYNANLFYERGVHAQCSDCNFRLHGNQYKYARVIIKLYGASVIAEIEANNKLYVKFTITDLLEKEEEYKRRTKELCQ